MQRLAASLQQLAQSLLAMGVRPEDTTIALPPIQYRLVAGMMTAGKGLDAAGEPPPEITIEGFRFAPSSSLQGEAPPPS